MRLPLPGPGDVLASASAARDAVQALLELAPRAVVAMGRVETLIERLDVVATQAEVLVARVAEVTDRAEGTVDEADRVARDAGRTVEGARGVLDRVDHLLVTWEKPLRKLAPAAERFAESLDPAEVQAAIELVDRMPQLLDHVETDVLPMLQKLDHVGPDLHELLAVVEDLRRVVTGLPGVGLLRRRGDDEPPGETGQ